MFIRLKFVTNSSSTAFVTFGLLYRSDDEENPHHWQTIQDALPQARQDWCKSWTPEIHHLLNNSYKMKYKAKYPEKVEQRPSLDGNRGKIWEYIKLPVKVEAPGLEEYAEPYILVTVVDATTGTDDAEAEAFDPDKIPKQVMIADLKEFCELVGIEYIEASWYVKGTFL
jgi:hypothetical protein